MWDEDLVIFFFFSSRRRHTRCSRDWSSDVCSSDLRPGPLWPVTAAVWSEHWLDQDQRLRAMETDLRADGVCVLRGGRVARWDLEVRGGFFGAARLLMGVEEHAGGKQLIRVRWWPVMP